MSRTVPAPTPAEIVAFWKEAGDARWFGAGPVFDAEIAIRFGAASRAACAALAEGPHPWEGEAESALALMLLTDQFPRNIHRGLVESWSCDTLALQAAKRIVDAGLDRQIEGDLRVFFTLPFSHSENPDDQRRCCELTEAAFGPDSEYLDHAQAHARIIERFGRFPERNAVLGRPTTPQERDWIAAGGYMAEWERGA